MVMQRARSVPAAVIAALAILVPFLALEVWTRARLFDHVSYSNSRSLDASWKALNAARDWSIVYIGDSEVRWGFDPDPVDQALARAGLKARGFNMAIDGFSGALSQTMMRYLDLPRRMPALKVAVIGTQMIEAQRDRPILRYGDMGCDGALQKPVFNSPMARDLGFDHLCLTPHWTNFPVRSAETVSAVMRHRRALRAHLVSWSEEPPKSIAFNSTALEHRANGFQPNKPVREARRNHELAWENRKQQVARTPSMRGPLDPAAWPRLIAPGGYFDRWAEAFRSRGILPVMVALPTNPVLIDLQERRGEYARNVELLRQWERRRGDVVFLDLGIKDNYDAEGDYSDFRHLSIHGAEKFSRELGDALAAHPLVKAALARR
jgi:hypothetical protein